MTSDNDSVPFTRDHWRLFYCGIPARRARLLFYSTLYYLQQVAIVHKVISDADHFPGVAEHRTPELRPERGAENRQLYPRKRSQRCHPTADIPLNHRALPTTSYPATLIGLTTRTL